MSAIRLSGMSAIRLRRMLDIRLRRMLKAYDSNITAYTPLRSILVGSGVGGYTP